MSEKATRLGSDGYVRYWAKCSRPECTDFIWKIDSPNHVSYCSKACRAIVEKTDAPIDWQKQAEIYRQEAHRWKDELAKSEARALKAEAERDGLLKGIGDLIESHKLSTDRHLCKWLIQFLDALRAEIGKEK